MDSREQKKLEKLATAAGLTVMERGAGHIQLTGGPFLVNYYPDSKRRSAYIAGTTKAAESNVTPERAVAMAFEKPRLAIKDDRRSSYKGARRRLYRKSRVCRWCGLLLVLEPNLPNSATLDHVIPLSLGGLDNSNNWVLACEPCNARRGSEMPEVNTIPAGIK